MLEDNEIREKVKSIISSFVKEGECVNKQGTFEENGIGSLNFVKIMVEIEIQFKIEIDDGYYTWEYKSIKEFTDKITDYLSGGNQKC